jgi:hypothetical protein
MKNSAIVRASGAGALLITCFLLLTHRGLHTNFTTDDVMNIAFLHGYGRVPLITLLAQALSVFSPEYRPVGGLYYRTLFALFGLHPAPFRIVFFGLLIANLLLAAGWYRRLSRSGMTAACAALLFTFHPTLAGLYYNNGTVYDVLCVFFVLLLLSHWVRVRQEHRLVEGNSLLLVVALYGAALGSKEMAVTIPAVLVLYEVIFHPDRQDLSGRIRPIALLGVMTVVWAAIKLLVPNQMNINPAYAPHYAPAFLGSSYLHYYRALFGDHLSGGVLTVGLIAALAIAAVSRNRLMLFGLLLANLTLIPVCLIAERAGFVWYMPLLGLALYGGAALSLLMDLLPGFPIRAVAFTALVAGFYGFELRYARNLEAAFLPDQRHLSALLTAAKGAAPTLPHGSRVLMESESRPEIWWIPLFLLRLGYEDPTLWVDRVADLGDRHNPGDVSLYDMRMRWDGAQFQVATQPPVGGAPVIFAVTAYGEGDGNAGAVRRGQMARIHAPKAFANCALDVAYRMPDDELMRGGVWFHWTELDVSGSGTARVSVDAERGLVVMDRVRACGSRWMPAQAQFVTDP